MKADRVIGLAVAAGGLGLAALAAQIDTLASSPTLSARFFPVLLAVVLVVAGAALALWPGDRALSDAVAAVTVLRALAIAALLLAYALTFRHVDYRLGTWAFVLAVMLALGARHWLELLVLPVVVAAGTYVLFRHAFTVLLPTWN